MNRDVAASLRSQAEALGVAVYCPAGRVWVFLAKILAMNAGYHALSVHENVKAGYV